MFRRIHDHIGYYISLIAILIFGFLLVSLFSSNKQLQMVAVVLTTFFYVVFGIFHHLINHDLRAKIVIEYVLVASLGLAVVLFLLKGGIGL